ncbi:MAG: HD domain-containing protein, partial [Oscillospiraceae bacterium]
MDSGRYAAAYEFAARKHEGQYRMGGEPYISHPAAAAETVRRWGYNEDYQITALFHDLLEDTDASEQEIEAIGGKNVLKAVKLLTKQKGYVMSEYVAGIKSDPMAFVVKA